jgi:hypothetical protein
MDEVVEAGVCSLVSVLFVSSGLSLAGSSGERSAKIRS